MRQIFNRGANAEQSRRATTKPPSDRDGSAVRSPLDLGALARAQYTARERPGEQRDRELVTAYLREAGLPLRADLTRWILAYNRLDRAVERHRETSYPPVATPADDALYATHDGVVADLAKRKGAAKNRPNGRDA